MRRRKFVILAAGAAAAWPLAARAQEANERRIFQSRILRLQAEALASKVAEFINGIESQMGWTTQLPWLTGNVDERRFDGVRLLKCLRLRPCRGGGPALIDLLGGRVQVLFGSMAASIEHIRAGKLRALAVTTVERSPALPDIPTVADFVSGYEASTFRVHSARDGRGVARSPVARRHPR